MVDTTTIAIAFEGTRRLASGPLPEVARAVRARLESPSCGTVLVLNAETSNLIDLDLRGTPEEVERLYAEKAENDASTAASSADDTDSETAGARARGRPRLGVVAREITLLPRHWDWLATQPGGASVTIRRLVDDARNASVERDRAREATDATYRFLAHMTGNEIGFEEATRALFAGERDRFRNWASNWPDDVREHAEWLADRAFITG